MKKYIVKVEMRMNKGRLPLLAAFCLFIVSISCFCFYMNSSEKQAERILKGLYTADNSWRFESEDDLSEFYWERFGGLTTAEGLNGVRSLKLPHGLLEKGRKVVKTYAVVLELNPEDGEKEAADKDSEKDRAYAYRIQVEFYYDRGDEVMQPVETEVYSGTANMKKTGLLRWQLNGITGERIQ